METLLLPSVNNQLAPAAETVPPPGDAPEQGDFLQVLAGRLGEKTDGNAVPEDHLAQNPDSPLMVALLAAFAEYGPIGLSLETGTPSELGAFTPDGEPSSIPNPLPAVSAPLVKGQGLEAQAEEVRNPQIPGEGPVTLGFPVPSAPDLLLPEEEQGGQPERMDSAQNFIPAVKPQTGRGNGVPEGMPGKISSDSFSIPHIQAMTSRIAGKMNQEETGKFDSTGPKEEAPGSPKVQDLVSEKGVPVKENKEQTAIADFPAGAKTPVREEAQIPPPLSKDPASSHVAKEFLNTPQGEKEGFSFSGTRLEQVLPSGKESQTLLGFHGASADSASGPLGGAEKLVGGRETPAPLRFDSQGIPQQVGERVLWLIRNQEEKIRISLDPPELGHLFLEIHRTKENIHTTLYTDNPVTKVTLESNQREIQRIIESEGFKMERFDVLVQQDSSRFQERKDTPFYSHSGSSFVSGNREVPVSRALDSSSPVPWRMHSGSQYLDLFV
jgi:hypothetical protein